MSQTWPELLDAFFKANLVNGDVRLVRVKANSGTDTYDEQDFTQYLKGKSLRAEVRPVEGTFEAFATLRIDGNDTLVMIMQEEEKQVFVLPSGLVLTEV